MKRLVFLVFVLFLLSCGTGPVQDQEPKSDTITGSPPGDTSGSMVHTPGRPIILTIDELSKAVFAAVKADSLQAYLNLLPTFPEINDLISKANLEDQIKELSIKEFPEKEKQEIEKARERFALTVKTGRDSGIVWEEAHYARPQTNVQMTPAGFEQAMDLAILFTFRSKEYELRLGDCIKTSSGWRVSSRIRYDGIPDQIVY